ncbi:MAG: flavin-dependent oxidoreductase, F420-dependent methylene-tetrahydromethanopterin reductase [Deltaproteobacteria bacterium]|nr:flavin-dependent oxidoreductase, F420-dependent methylene-tetrahydromethanopterin reductase [Deltaproteobacteria bacterium]
MEIGINFPMLVPGVDRRTILEWAARAEAGPFCALGGGERVTYPSVEVMVTLSAAASITQRLRLLFSVIVLPMHSTVLMAKQVATLDVLSGGRVDLGLGVGARDEDYRAVGATFDRKRLRRMEEQIAIMRRVWAGENVVGEGVPPVDPRPVQPGGPPLLAGAMTPFAIERAARWADGLCGFNFGPSADEVAATYDLARRAWREAGRDKPPRLIMGFWYALGERAREQMDTYVGRYFRIYGEPMVEMAKQMVKVTSPSALRDAVRMLADQGSDQAQLVPTTADPDDVNRVADILG